MYSQRTILGLVDRIYSAVDDPALWPVFLDQFAHACVAEVGTLYFQDLQSHDGTTEFVRGMEPSYNTSYRNYYASKNIYLIRGESLLRQGSVTCSEELCPAAEVLGSEFYNDWVNPQKLGPGLNGVFLRSGPLVGSLGAIRAKDTKPFGAEDKLFLRHLMPHLQRAMRLRRKMSELQILQRTTANALNHWTTAVFLLDRDARVIGANGAATELLDGRDGLLMERGALKATNVQESALLHRVIRDAANQTVNGRANGAMLVERTSCKRPLHVFVAPSLGDFFGMGGHALVFVSDPEAEIRQADALQSLYRLTAAEARVAELIATGKSVKEIADATSVRENTVRVHLKKIFEKTGTKRQAELVKVILSSADVRRD